jgi:hypothetical protein
MHDEVLSEKVVGKVNASFYFAALADSAAKCPERRAANSLHVLEALEKFGRWDS